MFVRIKTKKQNGKTYNYLQIVENIWDKRRKRGTQKVLLSLGRLETIDRAKIDKLVSALSSLTEEVLVITPETSLVWAKPYGDVLVAERLWKELGLESILKRIEASRDNGFSLERAVFSMVYDRLADPGSKLSLSEKLSEEYYIPGTEGLELQHLYRSLDILAENKELIEDRLFSRRRYLFSSQLELVFFDTTSSYFEGRGEGSELKRYGHSRDKRPDRKQIVIGILLTRDGIPIAQRVFPGNTADPGTIKPALDDMRKRFNIRRAVFVCDRGMVSEANLRLMASAGYGYIVGTRMNSHRVRDALSRQGKYHIIDRKDKPEIRVKEVLIEGQRYIVCWNPEEAMREAEKREELVAKLEKALSDDPKSLIKNKGYRQFIKLRKGSVEIDYQKIRDAGRYDGKYVLQVSDPEISTQEAALAYRELYKIERAFRTLKSSLELRPIYHWTDRRIEAHAFVCFLALLIARELELRLNRDNPPEDKRISSERAMRVLGRLRATKIELEGKSVILRTDLSPEAEEILKTLRIQPPPRIINLKP